MGAPVAMEHEDAGWRAGIRCEIHGAVRLGVLLMEPRGAVGDVLRTPVEIAMLLELVRTATLPLLLSLPHAAPSAAPAGPVVAARLVDVRHGAPLVPAPPVQYSDWYYRRLDIHRFGSYAMLPLFVAQFVAGTQLAKDEENDWAEDAHPVLATGVGVLFASNTITGAWNLWEGRADPRDRKRRFAHAALMMLADAGFLATALLGDELEDGASPGTHRAVAIGSMAVATLGWTMMLEVFRD